MSYAVIMDIQQLRAFRSVVATGSVRAAAEALQYSPSAISQQITALQRDVGVALTRRSGRGVEPTQDGRVLAERIDSLLGEMGDLDAFVQGLKQGRTTNLTIGYFSSLGGTWLPRIVGPLMEAFPETRVELFVADAFDPARRPRPDLQFLVEPREFVVPDGYDYHPLAGDDYVVAMPENHPLAAREEVALPELAAEPWVDNDSSGGWCRQVVIDACASVGFQPSFRLQTLDYSVALGLVAVGLGVSVLPSLGANSLPEGVVTRPVVGPAPRRRIGAVVMKGSAEMPAVARLLGLARGVAAQQSGESATGGARVVAGGAP